MFNRLTILKRREVAQGVADRLMAAEHAIDLAIARTAELTGFIPAARAEADLACEVGQEALEYAAESFSALVKARAQMIASHRELAVTKGPDRPQDLWPRRPGRQAVQLRGPPPSPKSPEPTFVEAGAQEMEPMLDRIAFFHDPVPRMAPAQPAFLSDRADRRVLLCRMARRLARTDRRRDHGGGLHPLRDRRDVLLSGMAGRHRPGSSLWISWCSRRSAISPSIAIDTGRYG